MKSITSDLGDAHGLHGVILEERLFDLVWPVRAFRDVCDDVPTRLCPSLKAFRLGHDEVNVDFREGLRELRKATWFIVELDLDFHEVVRIPVDGTDDERVCFRIKTHQHLVSFFEVQGLSEFGRDDEASSRVQSDDRVHGFTFVGISWDIRDSLYIIFLLGSEKTMTKSFTV